MTAINPMQITEQNKQEAERQIKRYEGRMPFGGHPNLTSILPTRMSIEFAIQDRQSVLNLAKVAVQTCIDETTNWWETEITNITEQIEYLKSKL